MAAQNLLAEFGGYIDRAIGPRRSRKPTDLKGLNDPLITSEATTTMRGQLSEIGLLPEGVALAIELVG